MKTHITIFTILLTCTLCHAGEVLITGEGNPVLETHPAVDFTGEEILLNTDTRTDRPKYLEPWQQGFAVPTSNKHLRGLTVSGNFVFEVVLAEMLEESFGLNIGITVDLNWARGESYLFKGLKVDSYSNGEVT